MMYIDQMKSATLSLLIVIALTVTSNAWGLMNNPFPFPEPEIPEESLPPPPSSVNILNCEDNSIDIHFNDLADNEDGLQLMRRVGSSGTWLPRASWGPLPQSNVNYTDPGLTADR